MDQGSPLCLRLYFGPHDAGHHRDAPLGEHRLFSRSFDRRVFHRHPVDAAVCAPALRRPPAHHRHPYGDGAVGFGRSPHRGGQRDHLSEYAPKRVRKVVKPALEVLAGIPTVVYGYFALTFVTPIIRSILPETSVFNALSASIVLGIMLIPMVSSLSEDAMMAVPDSLRAGAYALGSTKFEVATRVVVPAALSGIVASFILALSERSARR